MSTPVNNDRILLNRSASDFAFRAGQLVERLLLDWSIEHASQCGSRSVTLEDVKACIHQASFDKISEQVWELFHDGSAGEKGGNNRQSREAA